LASALVFRSLENRSVTRLVGKKTLERTKGNMEENISIVEEMNRPQGL
jgi:hypothetical protein